MLSIKEQLAQAFFGDSQPSAFNRNDFTIKSLTTRFFPGTIFDKLQFTLIQSTLLAMLSLSAGSLASPAVGPLESCYFLAASGNDCSGPFRSQEGIPSSGTKCIKVGPDGYRHSARIGPSCPTLNIVKFGATGCEGASTGNLQAGPGCTNFNTDESAQSVLVSFA